MTVYNQVSKPNQTTYTTQSFQGKQSYDDSLVQYDSASVFYDSVDVNLYTEVSKPSQTTYQTIAKPS